MIVCPALLVSARASGKGTTTFTIYNLDRTINEHLMAGQSVEELIYHSQGLDCVTV